MLRLPRSLLLASCFIGASLRAAEPVPPEVINPPEIVTPAAIQNIPAHPRLLADAARWTELRELIKTSPTHRELYALLRRSADALLQKPPVDYTPKRPGENILAIVRDAEDRIFTLAMMYRLSGEKPYLDGALAVMRGLAATPWPEGHFLDPATACGSLAIGYDWLYDELTPAERDAFAAKIKNAGLELTTHDYEQLSFLWADFNWNQICNTGLTLGALAIADREPDLARYVVNRTIAMIPRVAAAYAPDGVYPEGPGYWAYGTSYQVMLIEALRSSLHTSHDLEKFPGFLESASVIDQVTGPSGGYFNYFDTRPGRTNQNLVYWFARETHRPELASNELARLRQAITSADPKASVGLAFALLWFPPATAPASTDSAHTAAPLHWQGGGHQPLAILRSAWNDPTATWFAIKGGTANYSHGHMDAGSFVLEAGGVRWALDPEIEDYLDVRSRTGLTHGQFFSYVQDSQRWAHFRLGPEGHNILRFDAARQNVSGHATISPLVESADGATVEVNLDSTYAGQAARVRRTATLRPDASVVLTDTWTTLDHPADVAFQWLTRATVTRDPAGLRLSQDGRTLLLHIDADQPRIEIQDVATLLDPKFDGTLTGFTRIVIHVPTAANTTRALTVTLTPGESFRHLPAGGTHPEFSAAVPHGEVHMLRYRSTVLGLQREAWLYTPPGYSAASAPLPLLVLQHAGADTQRTWVNKGNVDWLLDDLIASGRARPMIVLMLGGHPGGERVYLKPETRGPAMEDLRRELLEDAIPLVSAKFRVATDRDHTAIAGPSVGGGQALSIGLGTLDRFSWIGAFSSGQVQPDLLKNALADPAATNARLHLLYLTCATGDGHYADNEALVATLKAAGLRFEWTPTPGAHTWPVWRRDLTEFLVRLFQPAPSSP